MKKLRENRLRWFGHVGGQACGQGDAEDSRGAMI